MSRDMCPHGYDLREAICGECATPEQLRAEIDRLGTAVFAGEHTHATVMREMTRDFVAMKAERDALRLIVTEKFAERGPYVKPEDAAEVAKWVEHPDAVRTLLGRSITSTTNDGTQVCASCGYDVNDMGVSFNYSHERTCWVAAAWRALGDPRGAADIERAHDEALRMARQRSDGPRLTAAALREAREEYVAGQMRDLSPEMQHMLYGARLVSIGTGIEEMGLDGSLLGELERSPFMDRLSRRMFHERNCALEREHSDTRGMEAVEAEARGIHRMAREVPFNTQGEPIPFERR
jgi:hypothetical protein